MTLAVVIPVRAGSKGVPGKNLARVGGRPLLDWTVEAAHAARCVDRPVQQRPAPHPGQVLSGDALAPGPYGDDDR